MTIVDFTITNVGRRRHHVSGLEEVLRNCRGCRLLYGSHSASDECQWVTITSGADLVVWTLNGLSACCWCRFLSPEDISIFASARNLLSPFLYLHNERRECLPIVPDVLLLSSPNSPERAEGGRRARPVRVHAVAGRAVVRAVGLRGEEALPRLTRSVAHLRGVLVVHGVYGAGVRVVPGQYGEHLAAWYVAVAVGRVGRLEAARRRGGAVGTGRGIALHVVVGFLVGEGVLLVQLV